MTLPQVPNNICWEIKNFTDWFAAHNRDATDDNLCPEEVLSPSCIADLLNRWLCVFISETRAQNGEEYPSRTLYSILTGILRYMRSNNPSYPQPSTCTPRGCPSDEDYCQFPLDTNSGFIPLKNKN